MPIELKGGELDILGFEVVLDMESTFDGELNQYIEIDKQRDYYEGDYVVIPDIVSQELETKDKIMNDNVTISDIPYYETSNDSGITVYIGSHL